MTGPGDSSLITIAIASISGQRRTRTIVDRTMSMILFRNRLNQTADSTRCPLSPSFERHTTSGARSLVEQAGDTLMPLKTMDDPSLIKCRDLYSLHVVGYAAGLMSPPAACSLRSGALESMTDHHFEFPFSEGPD